MKFRIKKRCRAPRQIAEPNSANSRSLGNPYGRLFTADRKFSDLLMKKEASQAGDAPHVPQSSAMPDRAANTALTAPEKQAK